MNLHNLLFSHLSADSTLNVLGKRMCPDMAPKGQTIPYMVWQRVSGSESTMWDGGKGGSFPLFQITIWSKSRSQAEVLRDLTRTSLEGETLGNAASVTIEDYIDTTDTGDNGETIYGAIMEIRFHINGDQ